VGDGLRLSFLIRKEALTYGAKLRPGLTGIRQAAHSGSWLLLRTLSLRIALVATVFVATSLGTEELAVWHIVFMLFSSSLWPWTL